MNSTPCPRMARAFAISVPTPLRDSTLKLVLLEDLIELRATVPVKKVNSGMMYQKVVIIVCLTVRLIANVTILMTVILGIGSCRDPIFVLTTSPLLGILRKTALVIYSIMQFHLRPMFSISSSRSMTITRTTLANILNKAA